MTANLQQPWGADGSDAANNAPNGSGWDYLADQMRGEAANVVATERGWEAEHAGGMKEVLVAIGGLVTSVAVNFVLDRSGAVSNSNSEVLSVFVQTNYGLDLGAANLANVWIVAISNDANVANVELLYSANGSVPESGELLFVSAATDLSLATPNTTTFTVNSTSTLNGADQVVPRQPGISPVALSGTPFPGANSSTGVIIAVQ